MQNQYKNLKSIKKNLFSLYQEVHLDHGCVPDQISKIIEKAKTKQ